MLDKVCFNCFKKKENDGVCPHCGFDPQAAKGHSIVLDSALTPGSILNGRYLIGRALGQGGFGITYLAMDLTKNEKVAIKEFFPNALVIRQENGARTQVQPKTTTDEDSFRYGLKKFKDEAELLSTFRNQRHIVSIHRFFFENNTGYFVMEYVDGISLKAYVGKMGKLLYADAVGILEPMLEAIGVLHQKGLIHRDVSPDNIYIQTDGVVKLLDFGAARFFLQARSKGNTVILKPGYAPPEQYESKGNQGPWSDVYAIGATLYYTLTGKAPLDSISRKIPGGGTLVPPSSVNSSINAQQEAVLMRALALDPKERFTSAAEFKAALLQSLVPIQRRSSEKRASRKSAAHRLETPLAEVVPVSPIELNSPSPIPVGAVPMASNELGAEWVGAMDGPLNRENRFPPLRPVPPVNTGPTGFDVFLIFLLVCVIILFIIGINF